MRIIVTGSEGYLGSRLVRELEAVGHLVTGMDILLGPGQNASSLRDLTSIFNAARPEVVVHLAAQVDEHASEEDVIQTVHSNAGMTAVIAQLAGKRGARIVYGSTSDVYGAVGPGSICQELEGPFGLPTNLHGLSKFWGESVCKLYAPAGFTSLRFSSLYGPGMPIHKSAVVDFLWQAMHGMQITVHRKAERSFCWIGDAIRGMRIAIEKGAGPYNIGREDEMFGLETVAQMACRITGSDEKLIQIMEPPPGRMMVKRLSSVRLRRLGWTPQVLLQHGMEATLTDWVAQLDATGNRAAEVVA